ncbi:zinc finger protein 142 [Eucyclogobius newberryi]|uniref:zinc finger protein 142 n=1 Tax=Eucyclogobius newberryi TaxID=166745 RepID=UPI003B599D69
MENVAPGSEAWTDSAQNRHNQTEASSPEEREPTSSQKDVKNKNVFNKAARARRGRKAETKDKSRGADDGFSSKTYLPPAATAAAAQTFRTHRCPSCHRCFKMSSHLKQHLKLHFPDPELQCSTCKRHFTSKSKLRLHQLREAGSRSHRCHLCSYSAVERNSLRRHLVSVHADAADAGAPESLFACPVCGESFRQSKGLKLHMKTHNVVRNATQHFCIEEGCSFKSALVHLIQHISETHNFTPIECQHHACTAIFRTKTQMEEHLKKHQAYHCADCDFACSNKRLFARHRRLGHAGQDQFSCEFCDFKTFNSVEFERHVGHFHAAEKIHKCSQCDFVTAHKRGLRRHALTHTGEKRHKCSVCDFRCRDESYLSRHMLTHTDSKNYMCSECGYVTKWKHYLAVHMRKHAGDLRYECDQCSYRCHRMDQLNSHKLRHQEKSLICEVCAYSCKRKYELRQHMVSKHSETAQPRAVHKCKFCAYTSAFRQALRNHENCKHTKSREYRCALCSYTSFSSTSLFLHKRKTHGYVPGDKAWLQNYALKEKEKNASGNVDDFYNNDTAEQRTGADAAGVSSRGANDDSANVCAISELNVTARDVANNENLESPSEEYCTLLLTTLPSNDEQSSNRPNSEDVAENNDMSPNNATSFSSEGEEEASSDGEQNGLDKTDQIEEFKEIEKSVESRSSMPQKEIIVEDLKELEKIQANAMVSDGHVELLMLPTQKASRNKTANSKRLRNGRKLSCQDCGAEFKLRRNLDNHRKNKCVLTPNFGAKMAVSDASVRHDNQEVGEYCCRVETRHLDLQRDSVTPLETTNSSDHSDAFSEIIQDGNGQSSQAKAANSASVDKNGSFAQINGKFECNRCRFSAIRLATIERHAATCPTQSSKQKSLKTLDRNTSDESKLANETKVPAHEKTASTFSCTHCAFSCELERRLLRHLAIKHKDKSKFQCRFCPFTTKRNYRLEEHESIHTGVGRHACGICDKTFGALSKLRKHKLRLHDKEPTHFCPDCDFSSFSPDDIKRHGVRCHSGDLDFDCRECEAKFSSRISLTKHCRRVHSRSFTCKKCEHTCGSSVELKAHQKSKHNVARKTVLKEISTTTKALDGPFKAHTCEMCQFCANTKKLLAQHLTEEHENAPDTAKSLRCSQCEFACQFQLVLEQHLRGHGGKRLYKCTRCQYSSRNKQKMTWHIRVHTGDRPYRCEKCSYACTEPSRLKQHMRVHQDERKYLCPECGYKCKWSTQLKGHMTKHTGEKRFACADCDYRTNRADALRTHRGARHSSSRPFVCEECGKSFKTSSILRMHQRQHSEARPFTCGLCRKSFKWPAGLRHHFLSHTEQTPFCCRRCSYRAKQRFQVVRHLRKHHPGVAAEDGVRRDGKVRVLSIRQALEGATEQT